MAVLIAAVLLTLSFTNGAPIPMKPIGVYCEGCGESTPILWPPGPTGVLTVVEHHSNFRVRHQLWPNGTGDNNLICPSVPGSEGIAFSNSIVARKTLHIFGTNDHPSQDDGGDGAKPRTQVHLFWSSDPDLTPSSWHHTIILQLPQNWTAFNTGVTLGHLHGVPTWTLAIELGAPASLIGHRFTSVFATCTSCAVTGDLSTGWSLLDPHTHIYTPTRYSACPTLRYFSGHYYLVTLFENVPNPKGPHCGSDSTKWSGCLAEHIVRSTDLSNWEESPFQKGLIMGLPDGSDVHGPDHHIIPNSVLDTNGTDYIKDVARNETDDVNRSDMDMVTLPDGTTYVVWLTGNQCVATPPNPCIGFSGCGVVPVNEQRWLESFF